MLRFKKILYLTLLILCTQQCISQTESYRCERISVEQGLSHNAVSAIVQDRQGFLWFGTQDGLNRFDGSRFTIFQNNPRNASSLLNSNVHTLLADRKGNVWVGSNGGGLSRFDPETGAFERYTHDPGSEKSLNSNFIKGIYEDHQGAIWIGTEKGLNRLDPYTGRCQRYAIRSGDTSLDIEDLLFTFYDDSRGRLWIGHNKGVAVFHFATGNIEQIFGANVFARWIAGDGTGSVLVGTEQNIFRFDPVQGEIVTSKTPREIVYTMVKTTLKDNNDILWSNVKGGVFRYDPRLESSKFFALDSTGTDLSYYTIRSIYVDRSGIVWIGTYNGLYKLIPSTKHFSVVRFATADEGRIDRNNVRSFAEDKTGAIWVGTLDGFFRFDPRMKQSIEFTKRRPDFSSLAGTAFWSMLVDATNSHRTVLAGSNKVVFKERSTFKDPMISRIAPELEKLRDRLEFTVDALFQDSRGIIWIGFRGPGVAQYDPRRGAFKHFLPDPANPNSINAGPVFSMCETNDGALWFGTVGGGLSKFDRTTETFTHYMFNPQDANSITDNGVLSLLPDDDGILWVGTYAGLDRFDTRRGVFRHFTTADGLANNVIYGILKDNHGNLWLSSNRGLTRFNPETKVVKNYGPDDGVQDYEFNHNACLKTSTGEMYFGGINGFNIFHPDSVRDNPVTPTIVLVDLKILNRSVVPGVEETRIHKAVPMVDTLFLSYEDAAMTFEFAALEFTKPSLNQYAYKMEGFDDEWQYVGTKSEATYTNLDPGTYTLRAKGSNSDGIWSNDNFAIIIHITPPWWMTWWFRGAVALLFLSTGPIIYYRRVTSLKRQHVAQQEFSRRLIESQEQERQRIAAELHDGLGQDLLVIKNRALMADQVKRLNPLAKEQLGHILRTVTNALQSVRQTARNLRPYHLDRFGLTGAIRSTLESVAESSAITFNIQVESIDNLFPRDTKEMEVNVFRVVQESVNNILKHSEAKHALISIGTLDSTLNILIEDDGKGFDPAVINAPDSKAGMGISGISERVRILGGNYEVVSSPGTGTKVSISIPLNHSDKS